MNKWLVSISIAAAFAASPVYASVKNFEGFSAGVTINHAGSLFKVQRSYTSDYASRTEHSSSQDYGMSPGLQLQYRFPLGETFVLGVGGSLESFGDTLTRIVGFHTALARATIADPSANLVAFNTGFTGTGALFCPVIYNGSAWVGG